MSSFAFGVKPTGCRLTGTSFSSLMPYGDAEAEVGTDVAVAWQFCRRRVQQGLGASMKDLMEKGKIPVVLAPAQPKGVPVAKAKVAPAPELIPRLKPTLQPVEAPKEPFIEMLKSVARQATSLKPARERPWMMWWRLCCQSCSGWWR